MGSYILCRVNRAQKPFYIENIGRNIYSIEELCYYLHHNIYLIDGTLINEELADWIGKDLGLPLLAAKLRPHISKFADLHDVLYPIFKEINYLTYEEMKKLGAEIEAFYRAPHLLREKKKGDALSDNGMYFSAIRLYERILKEIGTEEGREDAGEDADGLSTRILHNLGCIYARMFQMDKAAECFWKAFREEERDEDLEAYLMAYGESRTPIEYESRLSELAVTDTMRKNVQERLGQFRRTPEIPVYSQGIDQKLQEITKQYHRSTGS